VHIVKRCVSSLRHGIRIAARRHDDAGAQCSSIDLGGVFRGLARRFPDQVGNDIRIQHATERYENSQNEIIVRLANRITEET
jgi:hypothetical protein